jgi:glutaredoxin 3
MALVRIFTTQSCPYCVQAKRLLDRKRVSYEEVDITFDATRRVEMVRASGRRTVPQVFIDDRAIGGFDELYELDQSGQLDRILGST